MGVFGSGRPAISFIFLPLFLLQGSFAFFRVSVVLSKAGAADFWPCPYLLTFAESLVPRRPFCLSFALSLATDQNSLPLYVQLNGLNFPNVR